MRNVVYRNLFQCVAEPAVHVPLQQDLSGGQGPSQRVPILPLPEVPGGRHATGRYGSRTTGPRSSTGLFAAIQNERDRIGSTKRRKRSSSQVRRR